MITETSAELGGSARPDDVLAGLWIVVPAYNEEKVVGGVVAALRERYANVVVVDDGSPDRTGDESLRAGAVVLRHAVNLGQGAALQTGLDFAVMQGARYVCTFDADGQHPIDVIGTMVETMSAGAYDVVLGSRFLAESKVPPVKRVVLRAALLFTRWHAHIEVTDTHNGLRLLGPRALSAIRIRQPGMAHASEILHQIRSCKLRYVEVPTRIVYTEYSKRKGQSVFNSVKILLDLLYSAWSRS